MVMVGYRFDGFLVEMLDAYGIMSIVEGGIFWKGVGTKVIHS